MFKAMQLLSSSFSPSLLQGSQNMSFCEVNGFYAYKSIWEVGEKRGRQGHRKKKQKKKKKRLIFCIHNKNGFLEYPRTLVYSLH